MNIQVSPQQTKLLDRNEIERTYGITRRWLEIAAMRGDGPPMIRISSRMIRYDRDELEAWISGKRVASTSV